MGYGIFPYKFLLVIFAKEKRLQIAEPFFAFRNENKDCFSAGVRRPHRRKEQRRAARTRKERRNRARNPHRRKTRRRHRDTRRPQRRSEELEAGSWSERAGPWHEPKWNLRVRVH